MKKASYSIRPLWIIFPALAVLLVLPLFAYRYHWGLGMAVDIGLALGFWVSVFSGVPLLAWWAEKRRVYSRYPVQTQSKLFHFLLLFTGRVGWMHAFRSLGGLMGLVTPDLERYWIIAVVILIAGEFFALRGLLRARTFQK